MSERPDGLDAQALKEAERVQWAARKDGLGRNAALAAAIAAYLSRIPRSHEDEARDETSGSIGPGDAISHPL